MRIQTHNLFVPYLHRQGAAMLTGTDWVLSHLLSVDGKRGNTSAGRAFVAHFEEVGGTLIFACDSCGYRERTLDLHRMRSLMGHRRNHLKKWGRHLCNRCARKAGRRQREVTTSDPDWKEAHSRTVREGMAGMSPEAKDVWKERITNSLNDTYSKMTSEERSRGVVTQWASMTDAQKQTRADKIRVWAKSFWASMTPEERAAHVEKCIKGLPRSAVSDAFRQALLDEGLYGGFQSEVMISGYVVDEAHKGLKIAVEFFGDYYHCNPRIYDGTWYNTTLGMTAAEKWRYDRRRFGVIRASGYDIVVVWELEWNNNPGKAFQRVRDCLERRQKCLQ